MRLARLRIPIVVERAFDIVVMAGLATALIRTPNGVARALLAVALVLLPLGWIAAWRRRK